MYEMFSNLLYAYRNNWLQAAGGERKKKKKVDNPCIMSQW